MVKEFITAFREAFGEGAQLPLVFWYSDQAMGDDKARSGCLFKYLSVARTGKVVSMSADTIVCPGGKLYTGFGPVPPYVPQFVSLKERYKRTPDDVIAYIESLELEAATGYYLNFARVDCVESFDNVEGVFFYATPDMLAGLCTWAYFDNNDEQAVASIFGSGCSSVISLARRENRRGGRSCFLGGFDPSVRPYFRANELSFVVPASRWGEMLGTMRQSCLYDTHAWSVVKKRIVR